MFYADDGMVASSDPAWLQGAFSALVAIFGRVGLQTNVGKTVSMACHPCRAGAGNRTEAGYSRRLTGVGKTCTERQRERHWIDGFVAETAEKGETGREGRHQSAVFYADDGMVASSDPAWLQGTWYIPSRYIL